MKSFVVGVAVAIGLLAGLTGCTISRDQPQPRDVDEATITLVTPTAQPGDVLPQASLWTEIETPLATYAVYLNGPQQTAAEQAEERSWYEQFQNKIADCMARRGFRYVPLTQDYSISTFGVGSMLGFVPVPYLSTDLTVVEREGYGLYALEDASEDEDPNTAYLESISEAEADAYSIALNGDYRIPTTNGSCSREALDAHPEPTGYSDRTSVFHSEYDELIQTMISVTRIDFLREPSVMALNEQWESCMNSKGYVFDEANTGTGPLAAMSRAVHTRPDGTFAPTHGGELISDIPIDERSLSGTEFERKVAVDDYLCRQETNYLPAMTQIRQEIDEVLIAEHRVALDRLVSMAESW